LTLTAAPALGTPVIYRVGRWQQSPTSVGVSGTTVTVNAGGDVPQVSSEVAANRSTQSAWFYDEQAKRLIVKLVP
jgi:hypothetical protein